MHRNEPQASVGMYRCAVICIGVPVWMCARASATSWVSVLQHVFDLLGMLFPRFWTSSGQVSVQFYSMSGKLQTLKIYISTVFLTVYLIAYFGAMVKAYGTVSVIQGKPIFLFLVFFITSQLQSMLAYFVAHFHSQECCNTLKLF